MYLIGIWNYLGISYDRNVIAFEALIESKELIINGDKIQLSLTPIFHPLYAIIEIQIYSMFHHINTLFLQLNDCIWLCAGRVRFQMQIPSYSRNLQTTITIGIYFSF